MHLALVPGAAYPVHEVPVLQPVQNRGDRRLAQAHFLRNGTDRHLTKVPNRSHDQQLRPGQPGMLAQALGMEVGCPDNTSQSHQHIFITVHSNTPIRDWQFIYTPKY